MSYLYEMERKGKRARQRRDRERECVREQWEEVESVVKATIAENLIVGIRIGLRW